ncbi:hypothetical protein JW977_00615 [Candidatus Falkowbacteria bacterium]|nr:hypothetical protein [Candidatus Falkowbacteria bacterium]
MKKILFLVLILSLFILAGCTPKTDNQMPIGTNDNNQTVAGKCTPGPVDLVNYGDKGKRLANCFVEYPGEPTRQDKSYYIIEDICGQFTKEFMENLLGLPIVKIEPPKISSLYNCRYYFNETDYIWLNMDYLSVENQKKGHEMMGRTIKIDDRINMNHFVVWQSDGLINEIYLVLDDNKFISINRSSGKVLDNDKILDFAIKLANEIKSYK